MHPSIFINISAEDLSTSVPFYKAIGFVPFPICTDETSAMLSLASNGYTPAKDAPPAISVMLHTRDKFDGFLPMDRAGIDAKTSNEVMLCLAAESKAEVDELLEKAKKAGAKTDLGMKMGEMQNECVYCRTFADPDGHIWEVVWQKPGMMTAGEGKE